MKQGQTGPYLCAGNDGNLYVVKGKNTNYRGLVCEWVCGHLGRSIGLPIPDIDILYVDHSLLEYGNYELTQGDWFASKYEKNIQDVPFQKLTELDRECLKLLFLFDYWIKNGDRTLTERGGNPNLFIRSDLCSLIVLDHNLAFDVDHDKDFDKLKMLHVGSSAWFSEQRTLFDKERYQLLLSQSFDKLDVILESIPEEWLENLGGNRIFEEIRGVLARFTTPEFWEVIQ